MSCLAIYRFFKRIFLSFFFLLPIVICLSSDLLSCLKKAVYSVSSSKLRNKFVEWVSTCFWTETWVEQKHLQEKGATVTKDIVLCAWGTAYSHPNMLCSCSQYKYWMSYIALFTVTICRKKSCRKFIDL